MVSSPARLLALRLADAFGHGWEENEKLNQGRWSLTHPCPNRSLDPALGVRNPHSTLSAGKPRTWGRGNARKSARGHPLTKVPRVGVIELSVERGA
jgi:hypothetical protein